MTNTFVFSSHSFSTAGDDTFAHQYVAGRISEALVIERSIRLSPIGTYAGIITTEIGDLLLENYDGGLNTLLTQYIADGQSIMFRLGNLEEDIDGRRIYPTLREMDTVVTAVAGSWIISRQTARLRVRDAGMRLQERLKARLYDGTGGEMGTEDMAGKTMPLAFGLLRNIEPQLVDPGQLIYQVNDGPISTIGAVYDAGIPIRRDGLDIEDYQALEAVAVSPGTWKSARAIGCFKLGSIPTGRVTADVSASNPKPVEVIKKILVEHEGLFASQFDLDDIQPKSKIGYYVSAGEDRRVEDVISDIVTSCGAVFGDTRDAVFRLFEFNGPDTDPIVEFTDREIEELELEALPYGVPWYRWTVGTERNWTRQSGGDLAAGVHEARKIWLSEEFRWVVAEDERIKEYHDISTEAPRVESFYTEMSPNQASRNLRVYRSGRRLYRVVVRGALFRLDIGDVVRLVYPRYNLHFGQNFIIVRVLDRMREGDTEFWCFGGLPDAAALLVIDIFGVMGYGADALGYADDALGYEV